MNARDVLAPLLAEKAGLTLDRGGVGRAVDRWVARRLEGLGIGLGAYAERLRAAGSEELRLLLDAATVPHTWFFRDLEQLEVVRALLASGTGSADVWIPGCASGEDAYTVALIAAAAGRTPRVLGTDVNRQALEAAGAARYGPWSVRDLPAAHGGALRPLADGRFEVDGEIRSRVSFLRHNVMDPPPTAPGTGGWELIMCRNLLIYFDRERSLAVMARLARALRPGGHLVLGASDAVVELPEGLRPERIQGRLVLVRDDAAPSLRAALPRDGEATVPVVPVRAAAGAPVTAPEPAAQAARASAPARASVPARVPAPAPQAAAPEPDPSASPAAAPDPAAVAAVSEGNDLLDQGDVEAALAAYARAAARDPDFAEARLFQGIALQHAGRIEDAVESLRRAQLLAPGLWPAAFYLALCYDRLYRPGDAVRQFRHLLSTAQEERPLASRSRLASELESWRRDVLAVATERCRRIP